MSAAECRTAVCSCAAASRRDQSRVTQIVQRGWLVDDAFEPSEPEDSYSVTATWAAHLRAKYTDTRRLVSDVDGVVTFRSHVDIPDAVTRIHWTPTESEEVSA